MIYDVHGNRLANLPSSPHPLQTCRRDIASMMRIDRTGGGRTAFYKQLKTRLNCFFFFCDRPEL